MCSQAETVEEFKVHDLTVTIEQDEDAESPREYSDLSKMVCWHGRYNLGDKHKFKDPDALWEFLFSECKPTDEEVRRVCLKGIGSNSFREYYVSYLYGWRETYADKESARFDLIVDMINRECIGGDAMGEIKEIIEDRYCILPLYLYDHSGITMNTTGFSCPWDIGQVGYIYMSLEQAKAELFAKGESPTAQEVHEKAKAFLESEVKSYDMYLTGDVYSYEIVDESGCVLDSLSGCYGLDYCIKEAKSAAEEIWKTLSEDQGGGI